MLIVLSIAFVFVCVLLVLLILIQRPKGGGLAGAFGGAGGGTDQAMFGAKTGDALTWITVTLFVLFLLLAMGLTWTTQAAMNATDVPVYNLPVDVENPTQATDESTDAASEADAATADTAADAVNDAAANAVEVTTEAIETVTPQVQKIATPTDSEAK